MTFKEHPINLGKEQGLDNRFVRRAWARICKDGFVQHKVAAESKTLLAGFQSLKRWGLIEYRTLTSGYVLSKDGRSINWRW